MEGIGNDQTALATDEMATRMLR